MGFNNLDAGNRSCRGQAVWVVQAPQTIKGHVQSSFDDASAASARMTQFYSMLGSRTIWHEGWKAVTTHPALSGWSHFNEDSWELYHTDVDRAELHDMAAEHPEKLQELVNLWFAEASANQAFPLDDRSALELFTTPRPQLSPPRNRYIDYPDVADVPESQAVNIRNRSYTVAAQVDIADGAAEGVLFAHGSLFGGHSLYVKNNRLHYAYDFVGDFEQKPTPHLSSPNVEELESDSYGARPSAARHVNRERRVLPACGQQGRPPSMSIHVAGRPAIVRATLAMFGGRRLHEHGPRRPQGAHRTVDEGAGTC